MLRVLVFDPFAGISGDMTIAALIDLGLGEEWVREFVAGLKLGDVSIQIQRVNRRGIVAPHVAFSYPPEKAHRHLRHVEEIIERSGAPQRARTLASETFRRIAAAEARVHGTTVEKVHFHEVGAMDAILDVLCIMAGVCELGYDAFRTRPVAIGSGSVDIEHGRYPIPAPATLLILDGMPLTGGELDGECTTPTGAAVLATLTGGLGAPADFVLGRSGFGAGTRNPEGRPNVLRLFEAKVGRSDGDELWLVQADVDDLSSEYAAAAQAQLLASGAADVVIMPLSMKKGRPGLRIEVLAPAARLAEIEYGLFINTSTIGLRRWPVQRTILERQVEERTWRGQNIRWKRVVLPGGGSREKPEYDDVVRAAGALGLTPYQVRTALAEESAGRTEGGSTR
jgi:pyridinium-3,5-bisthiocarboxylic acid mononucleotide nickel chelatase